MLTKIGYGMVIGLAFVVFSASTVVRADQIESSATVQLQATQPTNPVAPRDPNNPDNLHPGDPTDTNNSGTGSLAGLSLDYASNLHFADAAAATTATTPLVNQNSMVQISDRRGNTTGWTLQVKPNSLVGQKTGTVISAGEMNLGTITLRTTSSNISDAPKVISKKLTIGSYNNILQATTSQQGIGTWVLGFQPDQTAPMTLTVAKETQLPADYYQGSLSWSLTDAPS